MYWLLTLVMLGMGWGSENRKTVECHFMLSAFLELLQQIRVTFLIIGSVAFVEFFRTGYSTDAVTSTTCLCSHP